METILGQISNIQFDLDGCMQMTVKVADYGSKEALANLAKGNDYRFRVTELNDRTLEQNRMMWSIINTISERSGLDTWSVYKEALKRANVRCEAFMTTLNVSERDMEAHFRAVQKMGVKEIVNSDGSKALAQIWLCFLGSSKFTSKEMTKLVQILEQMEMSL